MGYAGRSTQGLDSHNFGGINTRNGLVNLAQNEALDIVNFDIAPDGALTRRKGYTVIKTGFTNPQALNVYFRYDAGYLGTEWWSIITSGKVWEASSPSGVWVDQTGAVTFGQGQGVSAKGYRGKMIACNGVDRPIIQVPGTTATTLYLASTIQPPSGVVGGVVGTPPGGVVQYYISAQSGRGLTNLFSAGYGFGSGLTSNSTDYNYIGWVSPTGAVATWIWKTGNASAPLVNPGEYSIQAVSVLDPTVGTWSDNGVAPLPNMALNPTSAGTNTYKYLGTITTGGIERLAAMFKATLRANVSLGATPAQVCIMEAVAGTSAYNLYVFLTAGTYTGGRATNFGGTLVIPKDGYYLRQNTGLGSYCPDFGGGLYAGQIATPLTQWIQDPEIWPATNTPKDWDDNGQPQGFAVLAGPKSERVLAWRNSTVWGSALQNPLDWYALNDAFNFTLTGDGDKNIKAIGSLVDYTVILSATQGFIYTGTNALDLQQIKIIPIGCTSAHALFNVDSDLWFWGQYGPTSLKRVMYGQDIEPNTGISAKVNSLVYASSRANWGKMLAFFDTPNNKAVFCYTTANNEVNDSCLVYNTLTTSWTKYDSWNLQSVAIDSLARIFALLTDGKLVQLGIGNLDGSNSIVATYKTAWYDIGTWATRKRLVWVDVLGDRQGGDYTFTVNASFDYGMITDTPVTCTQNTTDGVVIEQTSSNATIHRVYIDGFGESFQLTFSTSAGDEPVRVLGWRPDTRMKGIRGNG